VNGTSLFRMFRCHERNALAADIFAHHACLVETEQLVRIVDQQVEVREEIFTEDPANTGIGCLNLSEVLDHDSGLFDNVRGLLPMCPEKRFSDACT